MKILNTLNQENVEAADKLVALATFVEAVRTKYGNTEVEIPASKVATSEGHVSISLLTDAEKVAVATGFIKESIAMATAVTENTEGAVFDRVLEGFVAVHPILTNLDQSSESAY